MTDNAYSKSGVLEMEATILHCLEFNITNTLSLSFVEVY